eukprot:snap_masked-scaffold871_size86487-processed-gene-0.13 protein:Tk08314 transcript:snap_masked-scaffold871_size86487-processed-gene-0.13-mRNA-1 annotation:"hypothetical protein DAPPUDRAFT_304374"
MDHVRVLAAQAVQLDQLGKGSEAAQYYTKAANYLERHLADVPLVGETILKYRLRARVLTQANPVHAPDPPPSLERARACLGQALQEDEAGEVQSALVLYQEAVEMCLHLKKTASPGLGSKLGAMAGQALDRAEVLKQTTRSPADLNVESMLENLPVVGEAVDLSPLSEVGGSKYSDEEKRVLRVTSIINGREYVPFLSVDLREKFSFPLPFGDQHGMLDLAPKQKAKLVKWARPGEFMSQPTVLQVVDCYSVKQTLVSDCSFVASIAISAQYEKRFGKKLITSIIYPQNSKGIPVYNSSGKYMVKLRINGVPRKVVIDDYFPLGSHNEPLCSYSSNRNELWISLLEKAYMKVMGGYDFPGSNSNIDLYVLTGWIPERVSIRPESGTFDKDGTFKMLFQRFHQGDVLVTLATGDMTQAEADRAGLVATHAYALLDIRQVNGLKLFLVKNPWSHLRWKGNYSERDARNWSPELKKALNYEPKDAQNYDNGVFWIDYDSLCRFFDVIYMNWKPDLFSYHFVTHHTWESGLGPAKDLYDISNNPQYSLELNKDQGALWILLSRHITDIEDFKNNKEYITVLVYGNDGKKVFYPFDPPPFIDGVRINSPHYLCKVVVGPDTPKKMTLVVSQYNKSTHIHYTLRVYSTVPFSLKNITHNYKHTLEFVGKWEGKSAGGCVNYRDTHPYNPRYQCKLDKMAKVLIELKGPKDFQIGFDIKCVKSGIEGESPLSFKRKSSGAYRPGFAVLELDMLPGTYDIVPTTFQPGQEAPFFLKIKSSLPMQCQHMKELYLEPPQGEIHLHKLSMLAQKRLQFLSLLHPGTAFQDLETLTLEHAHLSEAVYCGSKKDRISHFALALSALRDAQFRGFFLRQENILLRLRIGQAPLSKLRLAFQELASHLQRLTRVSHNHEMAKLCHIIASFCESPQSEDLSVPFQWVSDLVSRRDIPLSHGLAIVSPCHYGSLITSIVSSLKQVALSSMSAEQSSSQTDFLCHDILRHFHAGHEDTPPRNTSNVTFRSVLQSARVNFPPCFSELFLRLVRGRRLPHDARIGFTLFLKDIGLPLEDSMRFWRHFYSQPPKGVVTCSHSWQKDQRKLSYSIKHLYGLVGSRRNYSGHSCSSICQKSVSSPTEVLLCPQFESAKLLQPDDHENWLRSATRQCQRQLADQIEQEPSQVIFAKPSEFFGVKMSHDVQKSKPNNALNLTGGKGRGQEVVRSTFGLLIGVLLPDLGHQFGPQSALSSPLMALKQGDGLILGNGRDLGLKAHEYRCIVEFHSGADVFHLLVPMMNLLPPVSEDEPGYDELSIIGTHAQLYHGLIVEAHLQVVQGHHLVLCKKEFDLEAIFRY